MTLSKILLNIFLLLVLILGINDFLSSNYLLLYFDICVFICFFVFGNLYFNKEEP